MVHDPYMITPEGMIVALEQKGYISYLKVGSSHCAPFRPDGEECSTLHDGDRHYVVAPAKGDDFDHDTHPLGEFPVVGPEPDPVEERGSGRCGRRNLSHRCRRR